MGGEEHELIELASKHWITNRCELTRKFAEVTDREESTVLRIPVKSSGEGRILAEKITRLGGYRKYRLYNVDIPASQLYMYEKNLFPLAYVKAGNLNNHLEWTVLDDASSNRYEVPRLKRIALRVKVKSKIIPSFRDPVSKIHVGLREDLTFESGSEAEKLWDLMETVRRRDPDIIFTKGGNRFTLPYLFYRARVNGLSGFDLGRERGQGKVEKGKGCVYFSYGRVYYRPRPFRLPGRLHVDLESSTLYAECGLQGLIEVARTCRIPVQRAVDSTIGTCMSSLQFYSAFKRGLLIPWRKGEPEDFKTARQLLTADRGGFCFEPKIGVHDNVGEVDFNSLYPTLMVKYNLSPETINCDCCPNSSLKVPELGYHVCERRTGLIPEAVKPLLEKRMEYKRLMSEGGNPDLREVWDRRQAAIKWILVSSFGYLGYRNARFGRVEAHIATCALARDTLRTAFHIAEEQGFEVIHGIVDSLWLRKEGADEEDYQKLCRSIEKNLGLPISFKGIYRWIAFPPSRANGSVPVINRYFGVFRNGTIKARGIGMRRKDTPPLVKKCQEEMLKELAKAETLEELWRRIPAAVKIMERYVEDLLTGRVKGEDLVIIRRLSKSPENYKWETLQAIAAKQLKAMGAQLNAGENVEYIILNADHKLPNNKVKTVALTSPHTGYDGAKYVKLLLSSAFDLLSPFNLPRTNENVTFNDPCFNHAFIRSLSRRLKDVWLI